jgi:two-component system response regulator AtoC
MISKPLALLVSADSKGICQTAARMEAQGLSTSITNSLDEANHRLDESAPDLALISLDLADGSGLELLKHPALELTSAIIVTGDAIDPQRAREAVLLGAGFVFSHPAEQILLDTLVDDLAGELVHPPSAFMSASMPQRTVAQLGLLHGSSAPMHKLYRTLRKLADSDAHVLLSGESGSGKDLAARTIHQLSERRDAPFLTLDCSSTPAAELEQLLFGAAMDGERDAGLLRRAFGGTLFVDEITELSAGMQTKLLHLLEDDLSAAPVSGEGPPVDVRIIAATGRDPEDVLRSGRLREDLYFRLASSPVLIPPLRTRTEDIDILAAVFLRELNERTGKDKTLSRDTLAALESYSWPGNVRELRSVLEQAYIMADQEISPEHLPDFHGQALTAGNGDVLQLTIGDSVQAAERKLTLATLSYYDGDKRKAARTLGVSLKTLYNRINAYRTDQRDSSMNVAD